MMIREMSREECHRVLAGSRLARLACSHENQPYIVPVSLAFDEASKCLYGFTTPSQKLNWMRANPLVCVEVDDIMANDKWISVIVFGRYEELPETSGSDRVRPLMHARSVDSRYRQCDDGGRDDGRDQA